MDFYPFKMHDKNIAYSKYADVCVSFLKEFALWYNFPAMQQTWYISEWLISQPGSGCKNKNILERLLE